MKLTMKIYYKSDIWLDYKILFISGCVTNLLMSLYLSFFA
jgi:hypothetical protein